MKDILCAVITGDIIDSTNINGGYKKTLHQIANDIKQHQDSRFILNIYRGDSFQTISSQPEKGLLFLLTIKAGLKKHKSEEIQWDAKMSLGIGLLKEYPKKNNLGELSGDPFIKSGRTMDQMKAKRTTIKVTTGIEAIDDEISAVCPLMEAITNRWTTTQADAIYLSLLRRGITQQQIGDILGKSQRAIGKSLEASSLEAIKSYLKRFEKSIIWTFKK